MARQVRLKVKEVAEARGMSRRRLSLRSEVNIYTVRRIFRYPTTIVITETTGQRYQRRVSLVQQKGERRAGAVETNFKRRYTRPSPRQKGERRAGAVET